MPAGLKTAPGISGTKRPKRPIRPVAATSALWLARHRWAAMVAMGMFSFLFLVQGAMRRWPLPSNMDEFSVLVAADTFAHGRVTNPTPPLWQHFETLHVIMVPTYTSKYPPAPSLMLAFAERVFGNLIWGPWLSTALACAALTWMLMAWLPLRWSLLGGFLAALHPLVVSWGRFYLCCNLGVLGAALLVGSAKRLIRHPRHLHGVLLALGVALLANVRPYEGAVLSAGVCAWLALSLILPQPASLKVLLPVVAPMVLLTFAAMGYYNWRVTGSPLKMPYAAHAEQYDPAPTFWFMKAHPRWEYRHENLLNFHVWELNTYLDLQQGSSTRWRILAQRTLVLTFWCFDLSMLALLWVPLLLRQQWVRPLLWLAGLLFVAFLLPTWMNSNYISCAVPFYFLLLTASLRRMNRFVVLRSQLLIGPLLVSFIAMGTFVWALRDLQPFELNDSNYGYTRAQEIKDLHARGGRHLILVRYSSHHPKAEEWIYNDADIPDSPVVWAHDMGPESNQELINRFPGREIWRLEADAQPPHLVSQTSK